MLSTLLLPLALVADLSASEMSFPVHDLLVQNILHEARGEPLEGQLAVLEVVYERTLRSDYPDSVTAVIMQPYQFSWTIDNHPVGIPTDEETQAATQLVYSYLYNGLPDSPVKGATHYLNPSVIPEDRLPRWYFEYEYVGTIGQHEFFKRPTRVRYDIAAAFHDW